MFRKLSALAVGFVFALFCSCQLSSAEPISPVMLRSEYLVNPVGIEVLSPRLSWEISGTSESGNLKAERGVRQGAYRVLVASSSELLNQNQGDLWDTGKVVSDQSNQLAYAGKSLRSRMQCFWKVMVWPAAGTPSAWSAPAHWSMGLLEAA
ncbi:MAG: alpha-L-rhamnosidase, partial [Opitutae bacterium]|nr:alpha-L-rhamnosidase [Opitutae bacterium]